MGNSKVDGEWGWNDAWFSDAGLFAVEEEAFGVGGWRLKLGVYPHTAVI